MTNKTKIIWMVGLSSTILFLGYKAYKEYKLHMRLKAENIELEKEFQTEEQEVEVTVEEVLEDELDPLESIIEELPINDFEYAEESSLLEQMLDWDTERLSEMRFDSSSREAWEQYCLYLLSDIPTRERSMRVHILDLHRYEMLFYESGAFVFNSMYEDRVEFFGDDSIYTSEGIEGTSYTFAEFLLQIARQLSIDLDQPMVTMLNTLYSGVINETNDVFNDSNGNEVVDIQKIIEDIRNNRYYNRHGYFGVLCMDNSLGQDWEGKGISLFDQYNQYIYDKIEYGMYAIPGKGDMNV